MAIANLRMTRNMNLDDALQPITLDCRPKITANPTRQPDFPRPLIDALAAQSACVVASRGRAPDVADMAATMHAMIDVKVGPGSREKRSTCPLFERAETEWTANMLLAWHESICHTLDKIVIINTVMARNGLYASQYFLDHVNIAAG